MSRGLEDAAQSGPKRESGVIKQRIFDYRLIGAGVREQGVYLRGAPFVPGCS